MRTPRAESPRLRQHGGQSLPNHTVGHHPKPSLETRRQFTLPARVIIKGAFTGKALFYIHIKYYRYFFEAIHGKNNSDCR